MNNSINNMGSLGSKKTTTLSVQTELNEWNFETKMLPRNTLDISALPFGWYIQHAHYYMTPENERKGTGLDYLEGPYNFTSEQLENLKAYMRTKYPLITGGHSYQLVHNPSMIIYSSRQIFND